MTILTKPNVFVQIKKDMAKCPVADESIFVEEEKVETYTPKPHPCSSLSMGLLVVLLSVLGIYSGMYLFRRCLQPVQQHRYQGFCSIPIDTKQLQESQLIEPNYRVMPLRWSSDPDVQVFSTGDDATTDGLFNFLREELDIGDTVEKITVFDNGRQTSFIHDFGANMTVDLERCFTMELDPELVLAPDAFVLSIEAGGDFDVTRVRSSLRAVLPALRHALPDHCRAKPVYHLRPDPQPLIRKRSVETPVHYIQFSGRRVQEIEISNLADLLEHEKAK
ncbi:hypothetical protein MSG28_002564 [Choristoneura fumiferana]|uniref:Uncharacterized protein n=1 Tax=Choristoneura fumiferana TaxID=7141 RepID=A0ACC0JWF6_CHOFU|nr:hypothetical protein MSG28_002564 [Choristoneura fumiferana]